MSKQSERWRNLETHLRDGLIANNEAGQVSCFVVDDPAEVLKGFRRLIELEMEKEAWDEKYECEVCTAKHGVQMFHPKNHYCKHYAERHCAPEPELSDGVYKAAADFVQTPHLQGLVEFARAIIKECRK